MNWASGAASVWADGEWIIAIARDRTDGIEVVAYDPDRDRWRDLPRLHGQLSDENQLVWTGSELVLVNVADGLFRLAPDAQEWTPSATPAIWGPVVWTGDRLLGVASEQSRFSLMEWDPTSDSWSAVPQPGAITNGGLFWTGDRALFPDPALAVDPSTSRWWRLSRAAGFDREEAVVLWAGDRLVMMGGWRGGPGGPLPFGEAFIPAW